MSNLYENRDQTLRIEGDTPFMAVKEYKYIQELISLCGLKRVLEWGSGSSTLWFSENCDIDSWTAVEHNAPYYDYLLPKINKDKVSLILAPDSVEGYVENITGEYDLIIIDGVYRKECLQKAFKLLSSHPQAQIILHDSGRKAYKEWYSKYPYQILFEGEGWLGDGWDHRGLTRFSNSQVTLIVTTCGRPGLLKRTNESFRLHNSYLLAEVIIRDDSVDHVGQIKSVEALMDEVRTPYVFHCEDDWEFHKTGFIEACMEAIKEEGVHSVWIRDEDDFDGYHRVKPETDGKYVVPNGASHGFSFNPHLYNMKYYDGFQKEGGATPEDSIGVYYTSKGLKAVWLPGYCKHIG